jgi:hypothetical protein
MLGKEVPVFSITTYGISDDTLALLELLRWMYWNTPPSGLVIGVPPEFGAGGPGMSPDLGVGGPGTDWDQLDEETRRMLGLIPTFTAEAKTSTLETTVVEPPKWPPPVTAVEPLTIVLPYTTLAPPVFVYADFPTVPQTTGIERTSVVLTEVVATFKVEVTTTAPVETTAPIVRTTVSTVVIIDVEPPLPPPPPPPPPPPEGQQTPAPQTPVQPPVPPSPGIGLPNIPLGGGGGGTIAPAQPVGTDAVIKALLSTYYRANRIPTLAEILAGGIQQ